MDKLSSSQIRQLLYKQESVNPDDLVQCPIVPSHNLKRKTLPFHVPDCHAKYGKNLLPCRYSQLHYFRTKPELVEHELTCPMRLQFELPIQIIPSVQAGNDTGISSVARLLKLKNARRRTAELEEQSHVIPEPDDVPFVHLRLDPAVAAANPSLAFYEELHRTVLFSPFREPKVLHQNDDLRKFTFELTAVLEEDEHEELHAFGEDLPDEPQNGVKDDPVENKELSYVEWRAKKDYRVMGDQGYTYRFEDERDSRENPIDFMVDWSMIPNRFRGILKKKYNRDNEIYKTGFNPRYRKCLDKPSADRRSCSDPREFEDCAAWFENLVWKPQSMLETGPDAADLNIV